MNCVSTKYCPEPKRASTADNKAGVVWIVGPKQCIPLSLIKGQGFRRTVSGAKTRKSNAGTGKAGEHMDKTLINAAIADSRV